MMVLGDRKQLVKIKENGNSEERRNMAMKRKRNIESYKEENTGFMEKICNLKQITCAIYKH